MENKGRTVWIVVGVIAVVLCCCLTIGAVIASVYLVTGPTLGGGNFGRVTEATEQVFLVGDTPAVQVDTYAGEITVRTGERNQIRLVVTKSAPAGQALDRITVDVAEDDNAVRARATYPGTVTGNTSVSFQVFVPPDAELDLMTGAGAIRVRNVRGEISAQTGAGSVDVTGATGPVTLNSGAGQVTYEGDPTGTCTFNTGAGSIRLRLPADLDAEVQLDTGVGDIDLGGFDVEGDIRGTEVDGIIGTGEDAVIEASTSVGSIDLEQR